MNKTTIEHEASGGENVPQTKKWRWYMSSLFTPVSLLLILAVKILLRIADYAMFDTHHFELKVTPKE